MTEAETAVREALAKMTPGEFALDGWQDGEFSGGSIMRGHDLIAVVAGRNYGQWRDTEDCGDAEFRANAAGIVALKNHTLALLAELDAARAEVARLREALTSLAVDHCGCPCCAATAEAARDALEPRP